MTRRDKKNRMERAGMREKMGEAWEEIRDKAGDFREKVGETTSEAGKKIRGR